MTDQQKQPSECLAKLNALLQTVKQKVSKQYSVNSLNKYRIGNAIVQPSIMKGGVLNDYQIEALEWMVDLASQSSNAILADDMGLGKTIQALSYLAYLKEEHGIRGKHLIVCPKTVCINWLKEATKWLPTFRAVILPNTQLERQQTILKTVRPRNFDVLITNYGAINTCYSTLGKIKWEVIVVDEAHKIKNYESKVSQCMRCYQASFKLLLTGTPLSNNLCELWSLLNFIMPDLFDDENIFNQIQESVELFLGTKEEKFNHQCKIAKVFHKIIEPFIKRRTKKELDLGLPPKIQKTLFVSMTSLQLIMYKNFLKTGSPYGTYESSKNQMTPRKICLHPYHFPEIQPEQQSDEDRLINCCGKMKVFDKLLERLINEGHKVLVFSQFIMQLDILENYCLFREYNYCRIDGGSTSEQREKAIKNFNENIGIPVFLLSTKAGGLGINLVTADRVIIYDIDWNPQNDNQAMDRAYRIGQTKQVHVYKLITEYTIEQRMLQVQKYKLVWDELVIQQGNMIKKKNEDPLSHLNYNHLATLGMGEIFRLELEATEASLDDIIERGHQKDKQKHEEMKKKLINKYQQNKQLNPFNEEQDVDTCVQYSNFQQHYLGKRKDNENSIFNDQRERKKFNVRFQLPAYNFYVEHRQLQNLYFQLYMIEKEDGPAELVEKINASIEEAKAKGRFHNWSQKDFNNFIKAHRYARKQDYEQLAQHINDKTVEQVKAYGEYYYQKAPNNQRLQASYREILRLQKIWKTVEDAQEKKKKREQLIEQTQEKKRKDKEEKEEQERLRKQKKEEQLKQKVEKRLALQKARKEKKEKQAEERLKRLQAKQQKKKQRQQREQQKKKKKEQALKKKQQEEELKKKTIIITDNAQQKQQIRQAAKNKKQTNKSQKINEVESISSEISSCQSKQTVLKVNSNDCQAKQNLKQKPTKKIDQSCIDIQTIKVSSL